MDDIELLKNKALDLFRLSNKYKIFKFSRFYNEQEVYTLDNLFKSKGFNNYIFFGGYKNASRKILGIFDNLSGISYKDFPIVPISFSFSRNFNLTHRDFLGSLTSLRIERNLIGDILEDENKFICFLSSGISDFCINNLLKISNKKAKLYICEKKYIDFFHEHKFEKNIYIISSLRIDCIIASILKISRSNSLISIKSGTILVNYKRVCDHNYNITIGDIITIKKFGKFIYQDTVTLTKKGKIKLILHKYI
ncbi:MAG: hypothetical protein KFW09_02215 [Oscillospiraceae bacterium]|nr:hypothetical protein [Oscillospiraceae bacterium]